MKLIDILPKCIEKSSTKMSRQVEIEYEYYHSRAIIKFLASNSQLINVENTIILPK